MVYCGLYANEGSEYSDLRDALEKLKLNDASLSYEPESSVALGFGFRCGFLGLLHMEIVQERLEREYAVGLIATSPSVVYHVNTLDGEALIIENPAKLPAPPTIASVEEPYVRCSIISPAEYIGSIMELCQSHRGAMISMDYISPLRVIFSYEIPLAEVIIDFFDQLKSRTKGYASMDYEIIGFRPGDLVKLEILLNGEAVDALSFIIHRDKAAHWGRKLAERLREVIPRQLFDVPIQAAIGNKIIARETVKAMRKNVLAKCYGGDITQEAQAVGETKRGQAPYEASGQRRVASGGVHGGAQAARLTKVSGFGDLRDWHELRLDPRAIITVATKNLDKFREITTLWGGFLPAVAIADDRYPDVDEHGATYEENAVIKARALSQILNAPALADDSGIEVEAMGWGPGVLSARSPYEGAPPAVRNDNVLQTVETKSRAARFVSVCALVVPGYQPIVARGQVEGVIAERALGDHGFGYDPIFWYPPYDATFGQVDAPRKHAVSHRGRAVRALQGKIAPLVTR